MIFPQLVVNITIISFTQLQLHLKPTQTGELHITGLVYSISCSTLSNSASTNLTMDSRPQVEAHRPPEPRGPAVNCSVRGHQQLEMSGPRLNNTKQEMSSQLYGPDRRLDLIVTNAMPQLQVRICFQITSKLYIYGKLLVGPITPMKDTIISFSKFYSIFIICKELAL